MSEENQYILAVDSTEKIVENLSFEEIRDIEDRIIQKWSSFTTDDDIKRIFYFWMGSGFVENRKIAQPFFIVAFSPKDKISTLWEDGEGFGSFNTNEAIEPIDKPFNLKTSGGMRGVILDAFVRIEFIIDHLLILQLGVYSSEGSPTEGLELIRRLSTSTKLMKLNKISRYRGINFNAIERIRKLRNQMAHQYLLNGLKYKDIILSENDNRNGEIFSKYLNEDYLLAIRSLYVIYYKYQGPVISWLMKKLQSN